MRYVSTRGEAPSQDFTQVLLAGLASDGGLYVPAQWPQLSADEIAAFAGRPYVEVAERVIAPFVGDAMPRVVLRETLAAAYGGFAHASVAPLRQIDDGLFSLELFHGPTLAFKDVAMQWLARIMDHALAAHGRRATIVGATSGDTGAAAIEAFRGSERVDVFILYPHGRVSDVQRRQMTGVPDANVHVIALEGTFDDAQAILKRLFRDARFRDELGLAGVNSINWARVLAQVVYYFTAAVALGAPHRKISFCVPTGNFGDIFAAWIAKRMGLPITRLVIATNENDILARTLETGRYEVRGVVATHSPSMDIQVSSNFERLLFEACSRDAGAVRRMMASLDQARAFTIDPPALDRVRAEFDAERVGEDETQAEISRTWENAQVVLDPHTAVGMAAARRAVSRDPGVPMIVAATAHPAKFPEAVTSATGLHPPLPPHLADLLERRERYEVLPNEIAAVERHIRAHASSVMAPCMTIRSTTLPSGLRIVTDARADAETVALTVNIAAGSRHESEHEHGLAHLLEHMAFKGTRTRSARAIAEEIESVGGDINAATATEQTAYTARVLPEDAGLAIEILADILLESTFDAEELSREKGVILQEIGAVEDTPDDLVFDLFGETAFPGQPIGRPILGTSARIKGFDRSAIASYLERHYAAPAVVIGAAGAVDHDMLVARASKHFDRLPTHAPVVPVPAQYRGGQVRAKRRHEQANIVVGFEGMPIDDPENYAAQVFSNAVGDGMSSRLFQEVRERRGLAYEISTFHWSFADTGLFGVHAATGAADAGEVVTVALDELARATADLDDAEIRRAKALMKVGMLASLESSSARAERVARQTALFDRVIPLEEVLARIDALSREDVRKAGRRLLSTPPTVAALGPIAKVPDIDRVTARLAGL